jgi:hypothetical protein
MLFLPTAPDDDVEDTQWPRVTTQAIRVSGGEWKSA